MKKKCTGNEVKIRIPKNKIVCNRGNKQIFKKDCIPGCNDACTGCENPQNQNIKAGDDTLTPEEHKEQSLRGTYRSSSAIACEDGFIDN